MGAGRAKGGEGEDEGWGDPQPPEVRIQKTPCIFEFSSAYLCCFLVLIK